MAAMAKQAVDAGRGVPPLHRHAANTGRAAVDRRRDDLRAVHRRAGRQRSRPSGRAPDDTAVILYTSGTTGQPKGAELTHLNLLMNAVAVGRPHADHVSESMPADPVVALVTLPLFHSFGQVCQMVTGAYGGITLVLLPRFDPRAVDRDDAGRARQPHGPACRRCTGRCCSMSTANRHRRDAHRRHTCGRACSGGAPMPVEVLRRVRGDLRRADPRRLWPVRDLAGGDLQSRGEAVQARDGRPADARCRCRVRQRSGRARAHRASAARSSSAATTS